MMHQTLRAGKLKKKTSNKIEEQDDNLLLLHDRLRSALKLGIRFTDKKTKIWQNTDAEVQRQVIRAISAFVSKLVPSNIKQPFIQGALSEIIIALQGILQSNSDELCRMSAAIIVKLTALLRGSMFRESIEGLVVPLSRLLSSKSLLTATSCARALKLILKNTKPKSILDCHNGSTNSMLKDFEETHILDIIIEGLKRMEYTEVKSGDFLVEFASLLATILWSWPSLRYRIGSEETLMVKLFNMAKKDDAEVASAALQALFASALCKEVALKQMEDKDMLWWTIRHCLDVSRPCSVRIDSLRFLQFLMKSASGFNKMPSLHLLSFVESIVQILIQCKELIKEKWPPDMEMLFLEASCTANSLLQWSGKHHSYFWKRKIGNILSTLLLPSANDCEYSDNQINEAINNTYPCRHPALRANLWDMLGWLSIHCAPKQFSNPAWENLPLLRLLSSACKLGVGIVNRRSQLHIRPENCSAVGQDVSSVSEREPICRAVLFLVNSPCKHIASETESLLVQFLEPLGHEWLQSLLKTISLCTYSRDSASDDLLMLVSTMALTTFSSLQMCQLTSDRYSTLEILSRVIKAYADSKISITRANVTNSVCGKLGDVSCCWDDMQGWDGKNLVLFYSLWAFAKLVPNSDLVRKTRHKLCTVECLDDSEQEEKENISFLMQLQNLAADRTNAFGVRWYAACSLASFGIYGFPSKLGEKMKKAYDVDMMSDLLMFLSDGSSLHAHMVVLATRCPSLLPSGILNSNKKAYDLGNNVPYEVHFSSKVSHVALRKVLEFVYAGIIQIDEESKADVRLLAKHCNLEPLLSLLQESLPLWGTPISEYCLVSALNPSGHQYSDIILESQGSGHSTKVCPLCMLQSEHVHLHRIVLLSNCDYFQALFRSGMSDSSAKTIQVPVCWDALKKLVNYFYTGEISSSFSPCIWKIMNEEQQIEDLESHIELSWIAEQCGKLLKQLLNAWHLCILICAINWRNWMIKC
eukprot:TRINITY_DN8779_c0_g1_i2.p1 TRINITY_DN8779_c0_g1~~TRINITY_DN8779_c0_g1_i2.p1  ORF type:complete len:983 (+),score=181.60 TRINITY_DN8779_c0_g1_i2:192-3140(+)